MFHVDTPRRDEVMVLIALGATLHARNERTAWFSADSQTFTGEALNQRDTSPCGISVTRFLFLSPWPLSIESEQGGKQMAAEPAH
jgi:hypothetical protein